MTDKPSLSRRDKVFCWFVFVVFCAVVLGHHHQTSNMTKGGESVPVVCTASTYPDGTSMPVRYKPTDGKC